MAGKIDIHIHVSDERQKQDIGGMGSSRLPLAEADAKKMLSHLDTLGIQKAVIMTIYETGNEISRNICMEYPQRYAWMCNVDFKDPETVYDRLKKYQSMGAVGVGELVINQKLTSPFIETVFDAAERLNLPVLFHMSPMENFNYGVVDLPGLPLLEQMLKKHPGLKVIGHSQPFWHEISGDASPLAESRNSWGEGPVTDGGRLLELFREYPNLYGDLSANSGGYAIMRDEGFGLRFLEKFQDRLMFGTDMSAIDVEFPLGKWLDKKHAEGKLSDVAYRKICYENAIRILGL